MINDEQRFIINSNGAPVVKSAATFVTDDSKPDPVIPRVLGEWICVRPVGLSNKIVTKGGLELQIDERTRETKQTAMAVGKIIRVGEEACKRAGVSKVEEGEYVIFPKYGGHRQTYQGVKVVYLPDDALIAVVNPEDVENAVEF